MLEAVVAGIPAMAEYGAALPDGQKTIALDALGRACPALNLIITL
jgi:hypothetical protein